MSKLIPAIMGFIGTAITASLIGLGVIILAGEVRLAVLRKANHGSTQMSSFTQRMTKTKLNLCHDQQ